MTWPGSATDLGELVQRLFDDKKIKVKNKTDALRTGHEAFYRQGRQPL